MLLFEESPIVVEYICYVCMYYCKTKDHFPKKNLTHTINILWTYIIMSDCKTRTFLCVCYIYNNRFCGCDKWNFQLLFFIFSTCICLFENLFHSLVSDILLQISPHEKSHKNVFQVNVNWKQYYFGHFKKLT